MKDYPIKKIELETGETLAYREAGKGETVVLLHGNMSSSLHMTGLMSDLEGEFRVLAPDISGFGKSTYNREKRTLEEYALDIEAFLRALDLTEVNLCGWSAGGGIAMEVAASPEGQKRVKGLLLLSSVGVQGIRDIARNYLSHLPKWTPNPVQEMFNFTNVLPTVDLTETLGGSFGDFGKKIGDSLDRYTIQTMWKFGVYNTVMPPEEDFKAYVDASMEQVNRDDIAEALRVFNITDVSTDHPGSGRINDIRIPVLWLHGEKDRIIPVGDAKFSKAFFPGPMDLKVFKNGGHSLLTDNPEMVARLARDFFKGII